VSVEAFRAALAAAGFDADVEGRERLAVIRPSGSIEARAIASERARIITLAASHGFSHVAVEVAPSAAGRRGAQRDAAVSGD
jgi:hypothetical protein